MSTFPQMADRLALLSLRGKPEDFSLTNTQENKG